RANIFMDGHEELAAELMWKPANASDWQRTPMQALGNDAWEAQIFPRKLGRYVFTVRAWVDAWRSFRSQLQKKHAAGVDVALEVEEARRMLRVYVKGARGKGAAAVNIIEAVLQKVGAPLEDGPVRKLRPRQGSSRSPGQDATVAIPAATDKQVEALLTEELAAA